MESSRFLDPQEIAPDTFVIRLLFDGDLGPLAVHANSLVITGSEPVLVDTGPAVARAAWLEQAFALVDPADVRWIFLSHEDGDHTGNVFEVLEAAPRATVVCNWFLYERLAFERALPLERMRWLNDGEAFDAGDHHLVAVTPPVYDSPTTRGLFDATTGAYWASDAFGAPVPHEIADVTELDPAFFREAFLSMQRRFSPWLAYVDPVRYQAAVDRIASLGATSIASAHGVVLRGRQIDSALQLIAELPDLPPVDWPGQADLDALLAAIAPDERGAA